MILPNNHFARAAQGKIIMQLPANWKEQP